MKSMKSILEEFKKYTEKVNSLERQIENRRKREQVLQEDKELFNEISRESAEKIYDWMRDTDGLPYDFDDLFDGAMRVYYPLASNDQMKLKKVVTALRTAGWSPPTKDIGYGPFVGFELKKVKQRRQRLAADGGGEYDEEVEVADLRLVRKTRKTIPAGPRQGEVIEKKEDTTMSKAIARLVKSGKLDKDLLEWWQGKQNLYTRDRNHRQIEKSFEGEDGSDYSVVVSRHPIDVLRMSDISNIRSCHSEGSEYFHCAVAEAKGHGPIAYLVKTEELENHLMQEQVDGSPAVKLQYYMNNLDRDEFREKVAEIYNLETPAGRWVLMTTWADTPDGKKFLETAEKRTEMASVPEKFYGQIMRATARRLGIEEHEEELQSFYGFWKDDAITRFSTTDKLEGGTEQFEKEYRAVYDEKDEDTDLRPISDFDDQELFRDRQRGIQGIGADARLRLRKFEEPMTVGAFAVPEHRTYGAHVPGFVDAVREWAVNGQREQFVGDDGEIKIPRFEDLIRRGGSYGDNKDGSILNSFVNVLNDLVDKHEDPRHDPYNDYRDAERDYDDEEDEMENLWEEYRERVDELNDYASNTLEHAYASGDVDGDEEPYIYASGGITYEIPLGWPDYGEGPSSDYIYALDDKGEPIEDFWIPKPWGGNWADRSNFISILDDSVNYYPEETEWTIDTDENDKPILEVRHTIQCEDCREPDDFDNFIDFIKSECDDDFRANREKIRKALVEGEYAMPSDWDNLEDDFSEMEESLENFSVFGVGDGDGEVIFSLKPASQRAGWGLLTGIRWPYNADSELSNTATLQRIFGGIPKRFGITNFLHLQPNGRGNNLFQKSFKGLQDAANEFAKRQLELPYGPEYEKKYEPMALAKNIELGLYLAEKPDDLDPGALQLAFTMRVTTLSEDSMDDIGHSFNFVRYIDKNMDKLKQAVSDAFEDTIISFHQQRMSDLRLMLDGSKALRTIRRIKLRYSDAADQGSESHMAIMKNTLWAEQNLPKMKSGAERFVTTELLAKLFLGGPGRWDESAKLPVFPNGNSFEDEVKGRMVKLGASFSQKEAYNASYLAGEPEGEVYSQDFRDGSPEGETEPTTLQGTMGEPRSAGAPRVSPEEDPEIFQEIYRRLQKKVLKKKVKSHLTEKIAEKKRLQKQQVRELVKSKLSEADLGYTQRTYKINFRIAMAKEHGGKREETENEMRAVPGVGTVKIIQGSTRQDGSNYYADVLIKFHLLGKRSVVQYIRLELLPALRAIEGLSVLRMDQYEEVTTMREWSDAYAGFGPSPGQGKERAVPTPTIDAIAQDWMSVGKDGMGIRASSLAHSVGDVTMIPVIELMRYLGSNYFSATTTELETLKQQIINKGPDIVQVAIGQNGRIKVTSGNDTVLAAKDIGLKELPVTFSLALQV